MLSHKLKAKCLSNAHPMWHCRTALTELRTKCLVRKWQRENRTSFAENAIDVMLNTIVFITDTRVYGIVNCPCHNRYFIVLFMHKRQSTTKWNMTMMVRLKRHHILFPLMPCCKQASLQMLKHIKTTKRKDDCRD